MKKLLIIFLCVATSTVDQNSKFFPYVTRSNTGTTNALNFIKQFNLQGSIEIFYVTRAYATRHGAGPLAHENPYMAFCDDENVPNEWQGAMRYAPINIDLLQEFIGADIENYKHIKCTVNLMITCIDQISDESVRTVMDGTLQKLKSIECLVDNITAAVNCDWVFLSYGPKTSDIELR